MFFGSIVAIITPFKQGHIDFSSYERIFESLIHGKSHGILVGGTTGEGTLISEEEREALLSLSIRLAAGRIPVLAGCSSASTRETLNLVDQAERLGCSGALVIPPCYMKPTQEGILAHFKEIYAHTTIPLIVYNNPARVGVDISIHTLLEIAKIPTVVSIKDCNTDLSRVPLLRQGIQDLRDRGHIPITKPLSLLCGDSPIFAGHLAMGGDGCISVTANAAPDLSTQLYEAWITKDRETFTRIRDLLLPLDNLLHLGTNPIAIKAMMSRLGWCANELRLPLLPLGEKGQREIEKVLLSLGISLQHAYAA